MPSDGRTPDGWAHASPAAHHASHMNILVVAPSWIGDTVLAQPLFRLLHARHPGLVLDVIGPPWTLPLLRRMPEIRRATAHSFAHGEFKLVDRFRLGRQLARERYDQAIVLPNTLKSALVTLFAAIPRRTGYRGESRWLVLNDMRHLDEHALPQIAQRYAALGLESGMALPQELPLPHLTADPTAVRATLARLGLVAAGNAVALLPRARNTVPRSAGPRPISQSSRASSPRKAIRYGS